MENLEQKIKNINELELPNGLHDRVVRSVMLRRYRFPLLSILAVVIFNVIVSGLRLHTVISENGAVEAFASLLGSFSFDYDFMSDFWVMVVDYVPLHSLMIFMANLILTGYLSKLYFDTRKYYGYVKRSNKIN